MFAKNPCFTLAEDRSISRFIVIRRFDIIDYRGFYLTRVGYIRAIRRRVGWIRGFIHGCKSKIEIGEGGQGS